MRILAIDPGPEKSGWLIWDTGSPGFAVDAGMRSTDPNANVLGVVGHEWNLEAVVIEMVASYGMAVGKEVFETVFWIGRFFEIAVRRTKCVRIYRKDVKLHFCGSSRAKGSNLRQALIDRFGGENTAIGGRKCPRCKGSGDVGRAVCPKCGSKKCAKCKGKGWFGRGREVCPECQGKPCPICNGEGWAIKPRCEECEGSGWEHPPGPLKGITSHLWAALALALYYQDTHREVPTPTGMFD